MEGCVEGRGRPVGLRAVGPGALEGDVVGCRNIAKHMSRVVLPVVGKDALGGTPRVSKCMSTRSKKPAVVTPFSSGNDST